MKMAETPVLVAVTTEVMLTPICCDICDVLWLVIELTAFTTLATVSEAAMLLAPASGISITVSISTAVLEPWS